LLNLEIDEPTRTKLLILDKLAIKVQRPHILRGGRHKEQYKHKNRTIKTCGDTNFAKFLEQRISKHVCKQITINRTQRKACVEQKFSHY